MIMKCVFEIRYFVVHIMKYLNQIKIMKSKLALTLILIIAFTGLVTSCKKGENNANLPSVQINANNNGKTIGLAQGQTLAITLGNPGDGGYTFNAPQYDSSLLSLNNHTHSASATNAVGDYGTDRWEFQALKTGATALTITAVRGSDNGSTIVIFTGNIAVK
jgi:predicted secreted protein